MLPRLMSAPSQAHILLGKNRRVSPLRPHLSHSSSTCISASLRGFLWLLRRRRYPRNRLLIWCKKEVESRRSSAAFAAIGTELA